MRRALGVLLAAWLALNAWLLAHQGGARVREDRAVAGEPTLGGKHARILGNPELLQPLDELLRLAAESRRRGDDRVLLVTPPQFGLLIPLARHHLFPVQVLDQVPGERGADALLEEARRVGARTVLWFRPARGWTTLDTRSERGS